ncbi:hypothetical protein HZH66_014561 [Vespula vulgaris]|uniref:Uncharacterized protein n=1 Tax=Vespula vulgaris TaxID=7454 RepID=A0A834J706_VESVU|nr:hypothetical protein HZH66_014561 [Vespula vulgaris]
MGRPEPARPYTHGARVSVCPIRPRPRTCTRSWGKIRNREASTMDKKKGRRRRQKGAGREEREYRRQAFSEQVSPGRADRKYRVAHQIFRRERPRVMAASLPDGAQKVIDSEKARANEEKEAEVGATVAAKLIHHQFSDSSKPATPAQRCHEEQKHAPATTAID